MLTTSQIWNRMLPMEVECFKTFSSFFFYLISSDEGPKTKMFKIGK